MTRWQGSQVAPPWEISFILSSYSCIRFQSLTNAFTGTKAQKVTPEKGVQSRLRDVSSELSGSIVQYPMSLDSIPLVLCNTWSHEQRQVIARAVVQPGSQLEPTTFKSYSQLALTQALQLVPQTTPIYFIKTDHWMKSSITLDLYFSKIMRERVSQDLVLMRKSLFQVHHLARRRMNLTLRMRSGQSQLIVCINQVQLHSSLMMVMVHLRFLKRFLHHLRVIRIPQLQHLLLKSYTPHTS